jgi:uncharacterized membrane protein
MYFPLIGRIGAVGLLIWALDDHSYGYFTFLRIIVCCVAAYCAVLASEQQKDSWTWILGGIAVLFNPIIPLHMDRETWKLIDTIVAIVLLVSFFFVKGKKNLKAQNIRTEKSKKPDEFGQR